jgi:hypothetical protein
MPEVALGQVAPTAGARAARGAASELRACAALMDAGFYVFRCEAPNAPFDLVAYRGGKCLRVEVKSITIKTGPEASYAPAIGWPRNDEWDLAVLVAPDRVFCFDAETSWPEARDVIRAHYGFRPAAEVSAGHPGRQADLAGRSGVAAMLGCGLRAWEIAHQCGVSDSTVYQLLNGTSESCGTAAGYRRHLDQNEDPDACPPCANARKLRNKRRRQADQSQRS